MRSLKYLFLASLSMSIATPIYNQLLSLLSEYSQYRDLRHLKSLAWMINALLCSGTINLRNEN